jgi:hypothetical protein
VKFSRQKEVKDMERSMKVLSGLCVAMLLLVVALVSPPWQSALADTARVNVFSETYDAASTVDAAGITNVISAPGAALGDACIASISVDAVDMTVTCYIQAAGLAEVRMQNESGSTVDLASSTWRVFVFSKGTR